MSGDTVMPLGCVEKCSKGTRTVGAVQGSTITEVVVYLYWSDLGHDIIEQEKDLVQS